MVSSKNAPLQVRGWEQEYMKDSCVISSDAQSLLLMVLQDHMQCQLLNLNKPCASEISIQPTVLSLWPVPLKFLGSIANQGPSYQTSHQLLPYNQKEYILLTSNFSPDSPTAFQAIPGSSLQSKKFLLNFPFFFLLQGGIKAFNFLTPSLSPHRYSAANEFLHI